MSEPAEVISLRSREPADDYNTKILMSFVRYLEDKFSEEVAQRVLQQADLTREGVFSRRGTWMSFEQFERFLQGVAEHVPDEQEFMAASCHRIHEAYGPLRFVLWATSPHRVLEFAGRNMHLVTTVARYEFLEVTPTRIHARYYSARPETKLMRRSQEAQAMALPTLWGLPRAQLEVKSCISDGAPYTEWIVHFYRKPGWVPILVGALVGLGLASVLSALPEPSLALWFSLPLAGAALGYGWESRRTYRKNLQFGEEVTEAVRDLARVESEARQENQDLLKRQREWSRMMEEQVRDRTRMLQQVVEDLKSLQADRQSAVQGVSHDLRNPLSVIRFGTELLKRELAGPDHLEELVEDMAQATDRMDTLLGGLITSASGEDKLIEVSPETVDVHPMVERLRRRLRALVHGREIRVSVFRTREAPEHVICDPVIMDRVLDNLLTNAAKYTESGSIVVEVGGTPGFLTVKISDTGRGIDPDKIQTIFSPAATPPAERAPRSFGVGLSVVVQLMDQIGGRLEVMSRLARGTTFWAHFPESIQPRTEGSQEAMDRVVTIRRLPSK